jgi:hypothetical protein
MRLRLLLLIGCVLTPTASLAGPVVQPKGAATLTVSSPGESRELTLADTITVTLTIEGSPALTVVVPRELPAAGKWVLVEAGKPVWETLRPGLIRRQQVYRCAPREPGDSVPFVFADIQVRDDGTEPQTIRWDPVVFKITTRITQPDRSAIRDTTSIEEVPPLPPATPPWPYWPLVVLALPAGAMLVLLRRWLRKQRPRSPAQRALYELGRLRGLKLPEKGKSERFMTLLTLLVRDYFERDCDLPARRKTTPELLAALQEHAGIAEPHRRLLLELFRRAEAVKFAGERMNAVECERWEKIVGEFLDSRSAVTVGKAARASEAGAIEKNAQMG